MFWLLGCPKAPPPVPAEEPPAAVEEPGPSLADGVPRDGRYVLVGRAVAEASCELRLRDRDGVVGTYASGFDFCSDAWAPLDDHRVKVTFGVAKFQSPDCDASAPCDLLVDRWTVVSLEDLGPVEP